LSRASILLEEVTGIGPAGNEPPDDGPPFAPHDDEAAEERPPSTWKPIPLDTLADTAREWPSVLARLDGVALLYAGRINGIAGEPGGMKTWLAMCAVAEVLRSGRAVLVLDFEDTPQGWASRLRLLGCAAEDLARVCYVKPTEPQQPGELRALLDGASPALVVLDGVTSAYELHGLEPNDAKETGTFYRLLLNPCAAAGAAVLTIDHVVKLKEQRGAWATGSGAKKALITGVLYQIEVEQPFGVGRVGKAQIIVAKDRPGTVQGFALGGKLAGTLVLSSALDGSSVGWNIEPPVAARADDVADESPDDRRWAVMERVSRHVEANPDCSGNEILCMGGIAKPAIKAARDRLERLGYLARGAKGSGRKAGWRSLHLYRSIYADHSPAEVARMAAASGPQDDA
jgi:hypothetical protein